MKTILDQPRDITVDGRTERYRNYAYLGERVEIVIEDIQRAEAELATNPSEAPQIWAYIAAHAACLETLLAAQEQWLADDDAALAVKADNVRALIRDLGVPSYKSGEEGGT